MADLIIIRLHPDKPISGDAFTNYLNGLTITAYDLSTADSKVGWMIGSAQYLPPPTPATPWIPDPATGIVQHFTTVMLSNPVRDPEAVATAVIVVSEPTGYKEYGGEDNKAPDLHIEISRGGTTIFDKQLYYDVPFASIPVPTPENFHTQTPTSLYLKLPRPIAPGLASLDLNDDGSPPNYQVLSNAVAAVLSADRQPSPPATLGNLTPDQARHVAYEILWGSQDPLPVPPPSSTTLTDGTDDLGALYTNPPNDGTISNTSEQNRAQFEGNLSSYYANHNANVDRLTRYIYALSTAIACETLTTTIKFALIQFPVNPAVSSPQTTISEAEVLLVDAADDGGPLVPPFQVPAEYFYALGAQLPVQLGADQRFQMAIRDNQERLLPILTTAVDDGTIAPPAINPAQAVRRLTALQLDNLHAEASHCKVDSSILPLVNDWLAFPSATNWRTYRPGDDPISFWQPELAAQPAPYLQLVLRALTDSYAPPIDAVLAIPIASVAALAALTEVQWRNLFGTPPNVTLLPPFTAPGTPETRVNAFIRRVQKFFALTFATSTLSSATADALPTLDLPTNDPIAQFVAAYQTLIGGTFTFGSGALNEADVDTAVQQVFPGDSAAQSWLRQRVHVINDLCLLAGVVSSTSASPTLSPAFSIAESLYARGFTSVADVQALSLSDFSDALRGTVAFSQAAAIYARAGAVAPTPPPLPGPFKPINPGSLVNCIPPCYLSPLGPVEYLRELLQLSEASTCKDPFAAPLPQRKSLGDVIGDRRGDLSNLAVTEANAETQLPLIDIVNENLENLVAILPAAPKGVVYDTANDRVANHILCTSDLQDLDACNSPAKLFEALPEHSSPAIPVNQPTAYDKLELDFSAPTLPYSQPLDICRTYLDYFATCRYQIMRTFRKEITEFALDPTLSAPVFQSNLWRYPVRIDIAIEYLQIDPEEYDLLFTKDIVDVPTPGHLVLHELYGFDSPNPGGIDWVNIALWLPEFLKRTGLTYCELVELQKSDCFRFVVISRRDRDRSERENSPGENQNFNLPDCEPCCLEDYFIQFISPQDPKEALRKLAVFLRLWRKLQDVCGARYTFSQLCDICQVLQLFIGASINPDFIRQLVAFQILKDQLQLKLTDGTTATGTHGADRTHVLSLWVGPSAAKWNWAVAHLVDRIQHSAKKERGHGRTPHFIKLLIDNLDPLSIPIGFDPAVSTDTWHAKPANTLRFAEVLAKICKSHFGIGELLYLFTADDHLDGDDPFPLQDPNEAFDDPLGLPDDDSVHSLWALRRKLLAIEVTEEETCEWRWQHIDAVLRQEFGYEVPPGGTDYFLSLGQHFFPNILEDAGIPVVLVDRQYRVDLAATSTSPIMWNIPPDGPFRYDSTAQQLWTQLPLQDKAVVEKLEHLRDLTSAEQLAVQNLYYMPRVDLSPFACFFPDFAAAERHLIEELKEEKRWNWFRHHFVLAYKRCQIIAEHLVKHVASATDFEWKHGRMTTWLVLKRLFADENRAQSTWEDNSGAMPNITWKPLPSGGAFAALLGLIGTGLLGEFRRTDDTLAWREVRGPLNAFGHEKNEHNSPVPTILPALDLVLTPDQLRFIELRNGFALQDQHGRELGGAESFTIRWSGVLIVDEEGPYEFMAGAPTPNGEEPNRECIEHSRWRVTITRGQKTWIVLCHKWPGEHGKVETALCLKSGAYGITVEFVQPPPDFSKVDDLYPQHTGFQVKYTGPDTCDQIETLPLQRLYRSFKDDTLDSGIQFPESSRAEAFLKLHYTSSLRDIRRTYQRAFKALLFVHRFELSGEPLMSYGQSELGYMLDHADLFAGVSYFRNPVSFSRHAANFDFNFLPLKDRYHPPSPTQDRRVQPSPKREQALFDWWERIFDYTRMRHERQRAIKRPVWLLFEEASEKQPDNPAQLLRHLEVDLRHAALVLSYFQNQTTPVYAVTSSDLEDDRWAVRAWHSDQWIRRLLHHFCPKDIRIARPDLWASDDPGILVTNETETGDANLSRFLCDGCFENGDPRRYADVKLLNNQLRERARLALFAYLCGMNRVPLPWGGIARDPKDLNALLLIDVETGLCETASRIEEAISAVQTFIQRARLGLEPSWTITAEFVRLWKHEFESFRVWEKCKCRSLYKENWIEWDELRQAQKIEAFQLLEAELRRSTLSIAAPGGLEYWPETLPPVHPAVKLLQKREASTLRLLNPAREGLGVLGTPERDARPSWLAPDFGQEGNDLPPGESNPNNPGVAIVRSTAISDTNSTSKFPLWIQAAIRLGTKFIRVAAGGIPPAAASFHPTDFHEEPGCCHECGCVHPPLVDEYYFWLVGSQNFNPPDPDPDEYYDPTLQASTRWHDESSLPTLLDWKTTPSVRLAWCRVHNGEFKQPRRSDQAVQLSKGTDPDLLYLGRVGDSLKFSVSGAIPPVGYNGTDVPGFRYDIATDFCISLPLVADPSAASSPYPAGLPVYPYFAFVEPGDRLFPNSPFSPAIAVASILRCHCRFEPALKWYQLVLNPLSSDNSWIHCLEDNLLSGTTTNVAGGDRRGSELPPYMCCDSTQISAAVARDRAILLKYLETLVEWFQALMRQKSQESAQQARLVLDIAAMILGPCPRTVIHHELPSPQTVATFKSMISPLNPRLMGLYARVRDGLSLVHRCMTEARLRSATKDYRPPYWGQEPCDCGPIEQLYRCEPSEETCCDEDDWCRPHSPYRFVFLLQKAQEAAAKVRELGNALLSAYDRGDAEYLASMRARHETQLADMTIKVRQDQWRESDWQVKALGKTKEVSQTNQRYYQRLINFGLNNGELNYQSNMNTSISLNSSAIPVEATGEALRLIPDLFVGFPCEETWLPLGTKLGEMFQAIARIVNESAGIASANGSLDLTQSGWQRRLDEWVHQVEVLDIEIEQIEIQILAAERRRNQSLEELNIQQQQFEQSREMLGSLRDKFTSHELYIYLQKETTTLYWRMYELAQNLAQEAQRQFNFELGYSKRNFLSCEVWDDLREGLLAGERLQLALQRMDSEYTECNRREYELTKHISLALHFPLQFLRLKITGCCEIELPEWMFDMDYPGHYMRRIKNVSLTIPCVTGPYTGVHCRLTLLSSQTRVNPFLPCPVTSCCHDRPRNQCDCCHELHEHYEMSSGDSRMVRHYDAREAIATSTGQNDSGLFELNFRDERHLPFEFFGAVSCWRIEIPPENNYFDIDSLSDVILHMNYTAREGGEALRDAARAFARKKLPGNGWIFLDIRKNFPDVWERFRHSSRNRKSERSMSLKVTRRLFPFLPGDPALKIAKLAILFETEESHKHSCPEICDCQCAHDNIPGSYLVEVTVDRPDDDCDDTDEVEITCVSSTDWPHLYHGVGKVEVKSIDRWHEHHDLVLTFDNTLPELTRAFILCQYEVVEERCETMHSVMQKPHTC